MPAGEASWAFSAAPLPEPLGAEDAEFVSRRRWYANNAAVSAVHSAELLGDDDDDDQEDEEEGEEGDAGAAAPAAAAGAQLQEQQRQEQRRQRRRARRMAELRPAEKRVVACHAGKERVAGEGFSNPQWVDARLFVYDDGTLGVLWTDDFGFLIDYDRMA